VLAAAKLLPSGRAKAISEAARVLRPGGRLVLADIWATRRHVRQLRELGWTDARRRGLGRRMWWGPGDGHPPDHRHQARLIAEIRFLYTKRCSGVS
jgi:SAM-dependent methyltransferase